ncbi:MAG: ATP-dependent 6-phosphofructokinase [Limnochordia bacterium]|nr:ATP-dependent 6-phosphofructokinase [Limnochordia bacterium]
MKRVGILTGGGDSSGINKAIVTTVGMLVNADIEAVGIQNGWQGLLDEKWDTLELESCRQWEYQPGTLLGTARTNPFASGQEQQLLTNLDRAQLDGLIAIGGDDTLSVAQRLSSLGVPIVGIPQTIDNDVYGTERCLGFDTALHAIAQSVNSVRNSNNAHERDMLVEVMGRETGWLAILSALLIGADYVLCPELNTSIDGLIERFRQRSSQGCHSCVAVVAEGFDISSRSNMEIADDFGNFELEGIAYSIAQLVGQRTRKKPRVLVMGYLQRGGNPTPTDLLLATRFAARAVSSLVQGNTGTMTALRQGAIVDVPLTEVIGKKQYVTDQWLQLTSLELDL